MKSFTAVPADIASYGEVLVEGDSLALSLKLVRETRPGLFVARAAQVSTREQAEDLRGSKLYVDRSVLPLPEEDEFYYEDLIGLKTQTSDGVSFGKVKAVVNYGAGDLLELFQIPEVKGARLLSFTRELVPEIRFEEGIIIVAPPEDFLDTPKQPTEEQGK